MPKKKKKPGAPRPFQPTERSEFINKVLKKKPDDQEFQMPEMDFGLLKKKPKKPMVRQETPRPTKRKIKKPVPTSGR